MSQKSNLDILLVHPGEAGVDPVTEHLGISYLKAYVEEQGMTADTLDMNLEECDVQSGIERVMSINPRTLGVSLLEATKRKGLSLIRGLYINGYDGQIIIGGYLATFHASDILKAYPEIGFAVRGEGELTLAELLQLLINGTTGGFELVHGITYRDNDEIITNPARSLIKNIDDLPMPDRKYASLILDKNQHLRLSLSRGCWAHCSFCDIVSLYGTSPGKQWRRRTVKGFVDEIVYLNENYLTDYFIFNDDNFLIKGKKNHELIDDLVSELERRDLNIKFDMMCRADSVERSLMKKLKRVGLQAVFLGIESFDQKHLDRYNKDTTVYQNLKAIITLHQLRIEFIISIILADAFTTLRDMLSQFYILWQIQRRYFFNQNCKISINQKLEIYRGSTLYEQYKALGLLYKDDWFEGYDYKLKFFTQLRLNLIHLENRIINFKNSMFQYTKKIREITQPAFARIFNF